MSEFLFREEKVLSNFVGKSVNKCIYTQELLAELTKELHFIASQGAGREEDGCVN